MKLENMKMEREVRLRFWSTPGHARRARRVHHTSAGLRGVIVPRHSSGAAGNVSAQQGQRSAVQYRLAPGR